MIFNILMILVIALVVCFFLRYDDTAEILFFIVIVLTLFFAIGRHISQKDLATLDEKIELYQEYNKEIDEEILSIASQYQGLEKEIFHKNNTATVLVETYPDLKSISIVEQQLEIYVSNREKVRNLQEKKISTKYNIRLFKFFWE